MTAAADLFSLRGSVAVVTGATSGIGLAAASLLASAGACTVLTGLERDDPEGVGHRLAADGLPVRGIASDAADEHAAVALVEAVLEQEGRIDTVLCNAGVALDTGPHTTTTDAQL